MAARPKRQIGQTRLASANPLQAEVLRRSNDETLGAAPTSTTPFVPVEPLSANFGRDPDAAVVGTDLVTDEASAPLEPLPIADGHHVVIREVDGEFVIGIESVFTQLNQIIGALLIAGNAISPQDLVKVGNYRVENNRQGQARADADRAFRVAQETRQRLREQLTQVRYSPFGPPQYRIDTESPNYPLLARAEDAERQALWNLRGAELRWMQWCRDAVIELWNIGSDYLPTHLMPVGEVFKERPATGDPNLTYHTGSEADPIPIVWYKSPNDYPRVRPFGGQPVQFGQPLQLGRTRFSLHPANNPAGTFKLQKVAHNDAREGQKAANDLFNQYAEVENSNGVFVSMALGAKHRFDGDHVKDLGFGGTDAPDNYWPLDSRINRRAFAGYNSRYIVNYISGDGSVKARAIGGLVGKWFRVIGFLGTNDGPVPPDASAGGT